MEAQPQVAVPLPQAIPLPQATSSVAPQVAVQAIPLPHQAAFPPQAFYIMMPVQQPFFPFYYPPPPQPLDYACGPQKPEDSDDTIEEELTTVVKPNTKRVRQEETKQTTEEEKTQAEKKPKRIRQMRNDNQPFYECPECRKKYTSQFSMWGHLHSHTRGAKKQERLRIKGIFILSFRLFRFSFCI